MLYLLIIKIQIFSCENNDYISIYGIHGGNYLYIKFFTYHETTYGKSGVKMICVNTNHDVPVSTPIIQPINT